MADIWMDVDTALSEVPVNLMPLIDDTDFKSIEGAVAYNAAGMALFWHFVTTAGAYTVTAVTPTTAGNYDWTDQGTAGVYTIEIPASGGASINNDTEGFGWFTGVATGILPWRGPVIGFRAAGLNDLLIDSAYSATRGLAGTALPAAAADAAGGLVISDAGGLDADAQRADVAAILVDTGTTLDGRIPAALVSGRIDASVGAMAANVMTAAAAAADLTTELQSGLATAAALDTVDNFLDTEIADIQARLPAALVGGRIDASVGAMAANVVTAAAINADAIGASELAADAVTEIRSLASGTADSGTTTTMVDAARTEADTDYWDENHLIVFTSGNIAGQARVITGFDPATDTITFTPATTQAVATQTYEIWPAVSALRPTVHGRTLDVTTTGEGGVDWNNIGAPTTVVNLSGTTIKTATDVETDTAEIGAAGAGLTAINLPNQTMDIVGNITGNLSGSVGSVTGAVGSVTGAVGSVTGAVGSVTGNVGGNVTGSVGSLATQAKADVNAEADTALADAGVTTTVTGRIDAAVSTRATPAQILATALAESYAADGAAGTLTQILYFIQQFLSERSISSTTMTIKKLDGSTTAATETLDSATSPTSITRAT